MKTQSRRFPTSDISIILIFPALAIVIHLLTNSQYGFHRDELYYLACANHLDFGYVDHPPLIAWLGAFISLVLGKSLFAVRLLPAIAAGAIVLLTGLTVRQMGGCKFAQTLGCLAVIIAPLYLSMGTMFTTNVFDQLIWALAVYLLALFFKNESPRLLLLLGLILGIGMLIKHTMIIFAIGIIIALLMTSYRRLFAEKYLWLSIFMALLIFLPNLIWQINHDWPTLEFIREAAINRMEQASPLNFFSQQLLSLNPINLILLLTGLYFYLVNSEGKPFRIFGLLFVLLFTFFALQRSKDYYLAPAYPMVWVGGAVMLERLANRFKPKLFKLISIILMAIAGIIVAPFSLPILPPGALEKLAGFIHADYPPVFNDMLGWENMVASTASAYNLLSEEERASCAILANNYGEAAALDHYGGRFGLPKAICAHNSYWIWGPRNYTGELILSVGLNPEDLSQGFGDVRKLGEIKFAVATWYESNLQILLWSKPKLPLKKMWPFIKMYY
jgi:hypothetical protein